MNIHQTLQNGRFPPHNPLDTRLLLQHVLGGVDHTYLIAHDDQELTAVQLQTFLAYLNRAAQGEPIPYIIGTAPFFDMDLHVSPAVLIPRPETEQLVETAVSLAKAHNYRCLVDVGTGSGCIAIALARELPQATLEAVDISADALTIARKNAAEFAPNRITFHQGNLLQPVVKPLDLIIANLPYVTDQEWTMLDDGVKLHEPQLALKGGPDGLDSIRELLNQATHKLTSGGAILLEIGWQQGQAAKNLAASIFPTAHIELKQDYAGQDRFVIIQT
ncbi:MAG: peptide chain release factor N(5)-glutamine methyltransferase [Anaerolineae bacterium]|nr:peptide chain release factor N(5)-glutamine methyltransferase [Anaerolineae bacterium]